MSVADAPSVEGFRLLRTIGPFDAHSLPPGLLSEHRLKPGRWALLEMLAGEIAFVWDDKAGASIRIAAGEIFLVPPVRPHHLEPLGPFSLRLQFLDPIDGDDAIA